MSILNKDKTSIHLLVKSVAVIFKRLGGSSIQMKWEFVFLQAKCHIGFAAILNTCQNFNSVLHVWYIYLIILFPSWTDCEMKKNQFQVRTGIKSSAESTMNAQERNESIQCFCCFQPPHCAPSFLFTPHQEHCSRLIATDRLLFSLNFSALVDVVHFINQYIAYFNSPLYPSWIYPTKTQCLLCDSPVMWQYDL